MAAAVQLEDVDIYSDVDTQDFVQDMREYGVGQALSFDADGVEAEAAAYLRAVRAEAARIPHVSSASARAAQPQQPSTPPQGSADSSSAFHGPVLPPPPRDWMCTVVDNFIAARAQVQADVAARRPPPEESAMRVPDLGDRRGWHKFILQGDAQPFSATLARLDNTLACGCLKHLANEATEGEAWPVSTQRGLWVYGLMVRLEKPVHPDVACVLRRVAVLASEQRTRLLQESDGESDAHAAAMYDTLRVLAGGYFGQDAELAPIVDEYLRRTAQS